MWVTKQFLDPIDIRSIFLSYYIHYIAKSIGTPLLMNRFDYFSYFHEYNV